VSTAPDLSKLSRTELVEYLTLVAALIKETDLINARYRLFDSECKAVLDGVRDEDALLRAIGYKQAKLPTASASTPPAR
jgi:hypothetical protein